MSTPPTMSSLRAGFAFRAFTSVSIFFMFGSEYIRRAIIELDVAQFLAAAEKGAQQGKRRRCDFREDVDDDLDDDAPDAELRVVDAARQGDVQVDLPIAVPQKRDGKAHGKLGGLGAFHAVAKGELIDDDLVFRIEFHVGDQVLEVEGEGSLLDFVSRIGA